MHGANIAKIILPFFKNNTAKTVFPEKRTTAVFFHTKRKRPVPANHGTAQLVPQRPVCRPVYIRRHIVDINIPVGDTTGMAAIAGLTTETAVEIRIQSRHFSSTNRENKAVQPFFMSR